MAADEPLSKDYDFSALSIEQHKQRAYSATLDALKGLVANSEVRQLKLECLGARRVAASDL
jgi:hypothetical protein